MLLAELMYIVLPNGCVSIILMLSYLRKKIVDNSIFSSFLNSDTGMSKYMTKYLY